MSKKLNNGNSIAGECWSENHHQMQLSPNQANQSRKQNKYQQHTKNHSNKYYSNNKSSFMNNNNNNNINNNTFGKSNEDQLNELQNEANATVPVINNHNNLNELNKQSSLQYFSPGLSVDQSLIECNDESILILNNQTNNNNMQENGYVDSVGSCSPMSSTTNENTNNNNNTKTNHEEANDRMVSSNMNEQMNMVSNQIIYDQQLNQQQHHQAQYIPCTVPQMIEIPGQMQSNEMYSNALYDYQANAQLMQQQQQIAASPQYYIYHPYPEYNQAAGAVPLSSTNSPMHTPSQQQQQSTTFYTAYQTIPSYIYDPSIGSYTNVAYSPVQTQSTLQQAAVTTRLASPQQQQQLASYQTPPQPTHQLYLQTSSSSNITPPTSLSPNDTGSSASSNSGNTLNGNLDRTSNCNSPQQHQSPLSTVIAASNNSNQQPMGHQTPSTGSLNQYLMYQTTVATNPYLTPQAYQCQASPIPSNQYMMYHAPPPLLPQQQQISMQHHQQIPYQTSQFNSPTMHTPYSNNNNNNSNNNNNYKYNNNKSRYNKYNNKQRIQNQKYTSSYFEQTPQSTYSLDSPVTTATGIMSSNQQSLSGYETPECILNSEENATTTPATNCSSYMTNETMSPLCPMPNAYPTSAYCDPNVIMGMPNAEAILNAGYNYETAFNGIETYGEDYGDAYDENNSNGDDNDENLACQVCRGRRMCFCYFLKVRYYKFPSFFDLVDHQYKKWRSTMAKNNALNNINMNNNTQQSHHHMMNNSALLNSVPSLNNSALASPIAKKA